MRIRCMCCGRPSPELHWNVSDDLAWLKAEYGGICPECEKTGKTPIYQPCVLYDFHYGPPVPVIT